MTLSSNILLYFSFTHNIIGMQTPQLIKQVTLKTSSKASLNNIFVVLGGYKSPVLRVGALMEECN